MPSGLPPALPWSVSASDLLPVDAQRLPARRIPQVFVVPARALAPHGTRSSGLGAPRPATASRSTGSRGEG